MAAVQDAMAPYVKKLIKEMGQEKVSMLLGISAEITKLGDNMEGLEAFLADAERRRITDMSVQRWVSMLKDAMYDATDIMELCQLEADERRELEEGGGSRQQNLVACCQPLLMCLGNPIATLVTCGNAEKIQDFFQQLLFCLQNPVFAHEIGSRIKELNQRLEGIHKEAGKYKLNDLSSIPEPRMQNATQRHSQKMTSEFNESSIVGKKIEMDTKELGQLLITNDNHHNIRVLSIVGAGGMGKTTLAQKIFNETTIQQHFKLKIWLSITQIFNDVELLQTAIEHAGGGHGGLQDKTLLVRTLTNTLSTGKFLLVMDDVWSDEAWNHVLSVPIKNASQRQPGSWVLITTRLGDQAHRMGALVSQHHVSPLDKDDAWSLLNKQLPPTTSQVHDGTDHLKDVGMKIISKCGGLPLAIKVMGGLLSTKSRSEGDWEAVLHHHAWSVARLPEVLDNAIYLSYEHLSPQLKQCFLYCSLFPKGTRIRRREVVSMWMSEGFIHPPDGSSSYDDQLEEIAEGYYRELITRNLIEPTKDSITQYSCTMHDVVRAFAEFMSKEESLVVLNEQDASGSRISQVRRLSIGSTKSALEWDILQRPNSLRTLIINQKINVQPSDSLRSLSILRVLFISGTDCDRLVDSLCNLRHLRYLNLKHTNISRLPEDIHRMKFLQHIVIYGCPQLDHLPSCITQLLDLRTLHMIGSHDNILIPKGFGQLTNLRTLYGFGVHLDKNRDSGWCSFEEIGPLSQLRNLDLHGLENVPASSSAEMAMISSKMHLDYLELNWSSGRFIELGDEIKQQQQQREVEEVIEKLTPPCSIRHLNIEGYFGSRLPKWMMAPATRTFKSLRHLTLDNLPCCTQLPNGLCQLPSLESLDIEDAPAIRSVGPEFQSPTSQAMDGGIDVTARSVVTFPNLTHLRLNNMCEWEEWDWEESESETTKNMAMPALKELGIGSCKLSCLPPGLASSRRHALRKVTLYELRNLTYIENFPSVVELEVFNCRKLKRISNLSKLQKFKISYCSNVEVLEGVPSLDSMEMEEPTMETLPEYMSAVTPRYLKLICTKKLYESLLTAGSSSSEYEKISHIKSRTIDYFH